MDICEECGYAYPSVEAAAVPARLRSYGPLYAAALAAVADPRARPEPAVWSALEYTCHARDVLRAQNERLALALRVDNPKFVPMGREQLLVRDRYNEQDPETVAGELGAEVGALADAFAALTPQQWERTGIYNFPAPTQRSMVWLGQHTVHELEHHLLDVRRQAG